MHPNPLGQCYKISPKWNDKFAKPLDFPSLNVSYRLDFSSKVVQDDSMSAYFTSEDNAYGIAGGRWYDGKADEMKVNPGINHFRIVHVKEYHDLDSLCSYDS